jgi:hypothetical protein
MTEQLTRWHYYVTKEAIPLGDDVFADLVEEGWELDLADLDRHVYIFKRPASVRYASKHRSPQCFAKRNLSSSRNS